MTERWRDLVLWVGAILGSTCLLWAIALAVLGLTPLVFTSGSMSPAIAAGDLSFARTVAADQVRAGDVVSVVSAGGRRVTHRVVHAEPNDEGVVLTLMGDANAAPDAEAYTVSSVERVEVTVPRLGYLLQAVSSPVGIFLGGLIVGGALLTAFGNRGAPTPPSQGSARRRSRGGRGRRQGGGTVMLVGFVIATVASGVQATAAGFSDSGTMNTGVLGSRSLPAPTGGSCVTGTNATVSWTSAGPGLDRYSVVVTRSPGGAEAYRVEVTGTSITLTTGLLGNLLSANFVVTIRTLPPGSGTWVSSESISQNIRTRTLGLGTACGHL